MDVSLSNKGKKRKSLAKSNNTPAKILKTDEEIPSKSPKNDVASQEKASKKKSLKLSSTPKAENKQNLLPKKEAKMKNGDSSEVLQKFPGTNSLKAKPDDQKERRDKSMPKKKYLLQKINEKAEREGKDAVVKSLNEKIDSILSRAEITKTAKRRVRGYRQMVEFILGTAGDSTTKQTGKDSTKSKQKGTKSEENKSTENAKNKNKKIKSEQKKLVKETESDDEELSDSENVQKNKKVGKKQQKQSSVKKNIADDENISEESMESDDEEKESNQQDQSDSGEGIDEEAEEEESDNEEDGSDNEEEGSADEEEEESENEEESSDADEINKEVVEAKIIKKPQPKKIETVQPEKVGDGKSKYTVFVGNLAYDTTKQELEQHFEQVGNVTDVRIPTERETNRPRGFGYVEFADEASYKKALDMNGSQLNNREIKVEFTQGGNKKGENQNSGNRGRGNFGGGNRGRGNFGGGNRGRGNFGGGNRGRGNFGGGNRGRGNSPGGFRGRGRGRN